VIFAPVAAPAPLPLRGPFAALTIDAQRRRVIAAGALSVAVLDADTGKLLATVRIGGARSLAVEPLGGHIFVGTSDGRISEIDADRKTIVRSLDSGSVADALSYDALTGRLYSDGAGAPAVSVFDARTLTRSTALGPPGHIPTQIVPDPVTHELYIAFADHEEVAVVDPLRGTVRASFRAPALPDGGVMRLDDALGQIVVVRADGKLNVFDRAGTARWSIEVPAGITACDLDTGDHVLACTGSDRLTFVQLIREAPPVRIATSALPSPALVALDSKTNGAVVLRSQADGTGAALERWTAKTEGTNAAITNPVGLGSNFRRVP
jgi:DNA-binding beta-propeller fold protein YncE